MKNEMSIDQKNKGGRPLGSYKVNSKKAISIKLPPKLIEWLDNKEDSRAITIEKACKKLGYKD